MRCAAVVTAAGLSSRMKEFKPMVCVGGETMIRSVVGNLRRAGAQEIVVVAGYRADVLTEHLRPCGVTVCVNEDYAQTKMFDSLCMGIRALTQPYDALLLTPGDVPLVQQETVNAMLCADAGIVRPVYGGRLGHPVLIRSEHIPKILSHTGERGLLGAIEQSGVPVLDIPVSDAGVIMDADTPQDIKDIRSYGMRLKSGGKLWPDIAINIAKGQTILTPETAQFVEMIAHTGSIQSACACMHMSYSSGWRKLNAMEKELGYTLVSRMQGGSSGGGSELTDRGRRLLAAYAAYIRRMKDYSEGIFETLFPEDLMN